MATLQLTDFPEPLLKRLQDSARDHGRELGSEAAILLQRALEQEDPLAAELAEVRAIRAAMPKVWVTDEMIRTARDEGRA